ncbi:MAG: thiamine phosphate synthase [Bacteroidales bacterium]|nr:thiamine phosphate synthase [Bacteroidales bacterium]
MLIVVSTPDFFEGESQALNQLFKAGLEYFHLRKPNAKLEDYENLLKQIPSAFHQRVHVHEHFQLAEKYAIGGVHLNRRNPQYEGNNTKITISRSCHTLQELKNISHFDYVFLSPIFNSISKQGYQQAFSMEDLRKSAENQLINSKVIALGGITPDNLHIPMSCAFGGVAVLGYIWQNKRFIENFIHINTVYQTFIRK